ncbi:MAG: DUF5916 domain-containing protein [Gemmatimonadetes bacterium]|nr:DUF5916 domain-containing protein [Gemmatimonadota bacterium]MDA1102178.1 DUF5916 domain-containing protein [Gemmatimonadota bacterium]
MWSDSWLSLLVRVGLPLVLLAIPVSVAAQTNPVEKLLLDEGSAGTVTGRRVPGPERGAGDALNASAELGPIELDGIFDEPDWALAPVFTGFTQGEPVEGEPAEQQTEVRILFGDDAIWIAARMWDSEPTRIDRRLTRRDTHGTYDQFSLHLDPNRDGLTGYSFSVSAANVQGDLYFYNDDKMDGNWDAVWSSAVHVDEDGWTAEIRIPLSQIRYEASDDAQTWGINFHRMRVANNERSYHTLVSRVRRGIVSQMGRLENVRVTRPSRRLEIRPYAVSSLENRPADPNDPFFDGRATGGRVGLDMSYGLGAAFTFDATINPDFGQVEADPAVINLTAFETFFPEQRPFFVEDARVFDFGLSGGRNSLFYSRRIGRAPRGGAPSSAAFSEIPTNATILGAAKLAGRTTKGLSIGALAAVTGNEFGQGRFADGSDDEFLVEPRSEFAVFSLAQDLNEGMTQIRGITTAMRRDLPVDGSFDWLPSSAINGGVRFEHQWSERTWSLYGFFAGSQVRGSEVAMQSIQRSSTHYLQRPDATRFSVDPNATSLSGRDWRLQLEKRGGEHWTGALWAAEVSKLFDVNDLGFSPNAERLDGGFRFGYREIRPSSVFRNYDVSVNSFHNWSHEALDDVWSVDSWHNARTNGNYSLNLSGQFLNYWNVRTSARYNPRKMSRTATRGGPMMVGPASTNWTLNVNSDRRKEVSFGGQLEQGNDHEGRGGSTQISGDVRVRPSDNLAVSVSPRWESATSGDQYVTATNTLPYAPTFGHRYLFADLDRSTLSMEVRLDWTFSPELSLQLFAQPLLSSGDYLQYKQLNASQSFDFNDFGVGVAQVLPGEVRCSAAICDVDGTQFVDFDNDGVTDYSFSDRDFNVRSMIGNAVLRWEYRPGSTVFLVWQRTQAGRSSNGTFDFGRDLGALFDAPAENRFIIKVNYWLGL